MNKLISLASACALATAAFAAEPVTVTLSPSADAPLIPKEIYGQFAEHLGTCIYGGIWVGPNPPFPTPTDTATTCSKPCAT